MSCWQSEWNVFSVPDVIGSVLIMSIIEHVTSLNWILGHFLTKHFLVWIQWVQAILVSQKKGKCLGFDVFLMLFWWHQYIKQLPLINVACQTQTEIPQDFFPNYTKRRFLDPILWLWADFLCSIVTSSQISRSRTKIGWVSPIKGLTSGGSVFNQSSFWPKS